MAETSRGSRGGRGSRSSSGGSGTRARSQSRSRSGGSSTSARKSPAKKGGKARGRQQTAQKRARKATAPAGLSGKSVAELRDAIAKGIVAPLNLVMLTRERIQEVVDDAVSRGRMTADDAQDLARNLFERGRKQTNDVLGDLEQLLGRGGGQLQDARKAAGRARSQVGEATTRARSRVRGAGDAALAQADRARRVAGVGPNFPILGYDDLTATQVVSRLDSLTPAELRKVRDYERRNANRKSVLDAIETKLS
jgi:polyhydroxyalkanoate synthesis regulator phasin